MYIDEEPQVIYSKNIKSGKNSAARFIKNEDSQYEKALSLILAAALSIGLVACGGTGTSQSAGTSTSASGASQPAAGTLSGTIRYASMCCETEAQADVIKAAIEEFTTLYPDVEITVDWMGRDVRKTIQASLDAGQYDLWDPPVDAVLPNYASYGYDLTELMAAENPVLDGKTYNDVANPTLMEAVKSAGGTDEILAVPYTPTVIGMFYNKDQFEAAGITKEPETWDEFLDVCETLKNAGFTPLSVDDGYVVLPFASYLGRLKGLDFISQLISDPEGTLWDDPAVVEAANAMQELWDKGYMSVNSTTTNVPYGFGIQYNADFTPIYKEQVQKLLGGQTDAASFLAACKSAVTGK